MYRNDLLFAEAKCHPLQAGTALYSALVLAMGDTLAKKELLDYIRYNLLTVYVD